MEINWKEFVIEDYFDIVIGQAIDGCKIDKNSGKKAYITRKTTNNGLEGFIEYDEAFYNYDYPVITIGNETATPFVQEFPFFTGTKVNIMKPKFKANREILLFICNSIIMHKDKYSYSFTINSSRLKKQIILLPSINNEPDYDFMETYIINKEKDKTDYYCQYCRSKLQELGNYKRIKPLELKEWKEFFITDIFNKNNIQRGKRLTKVCQLPGDVPYISSTSQNNGVDNFIKVTEKMRVYYNCLSVANSGSVGSSFYEPFEYVASDHITHLKNEKFNKYIYLFIACMTSRWSTKYNFNREINDARISREKILLPVNFKKEPDYDYMEQYIRNIMIKKYKSYLNHINRE